MQADPVAWRAPPGAFDPVDVSNAAEAAVELARGQGPLRRVLATLAGVWVARRGWEAMGHARLADHARERLGVSGRQVQELAHGDAALRRLPGIERALVGGSLSWTKVRLLGRMANATDEGRWLELAEGMTARALSREVRRRDRRAPDGCGRGGPQSGRPPWARETVQLRCRHETRARWYQARRLAQRVAGQRLAWGEAAEAVLAEVLSGLAPEVAAGLPVSDASIQVAVERAADGCAARDEEMEAGELRAEVVAALPVFLRELVSGLGDLCERELEGRLRRAIRLEQSLWARLGPLLLAVARERLYRRYDCPSMAAFTKEYLGMSPRSVEALLRIERACALSRPLGSAWREGVVSSEQALRLAKLVGEEGSAVPCAAWITHAQGVAVLRLEDDVERALATGVLDPGAFATRGRWDSPEPSGEPQMGAQTGIAKERGKERVRLFFTAQWEVARLFRACLEAIQRAIERLEGRTSDEDEALAWMLDHVIECWRGLEALHGRRRAVFERDGWQCTVPGCSSMRELQDHHVRFRSAGGSDALSNRTTLCSWHHLRGVHGGRVRCFGLAPDGLRFELGQRLTRG